VHVILDMTEAMELEQLLDFLADWMKSDQDHLAPSLARFLGIEDPEVNPALPGRRLRQVPVPAGRHRR
jgi:hypothetical protein